ncbi:hypothetical protein [Anderseniella sp. Alg231-50]|uniref:hypothetical protein n=1 Tax=Anderseniella sp. Alg231-50 TaxID=1922226 RepID=UPI000D561930
MPRIPTRDNLRQGVPQPTGGIVTAPRDFIGPAIQRTGKQLFDIAKKQAAQGRQQEKAKQQQSALELATARSRWNSSLFAEQKTYTPEQKPDLDNWGRTYRARATAWQKQAARTISDPGVRQRFMAETQHDLEQGGINIDQQARDAGMTARRAETEKSLLQQVDSAASQPDEDAKTIMGGVRATLQDMADTGIISVEEAAAPDAVKSDQTV